MTVDTIQLVHHCHTDIGYTHDQPTLWDLQRRFLDTGLDLAWQDRDNDGPDAFKWTVETTAPLLRWLESASTERLDRFRELEAAGRIEVTGAFLNITPLYGPAQTIDSLRPIQHLRDRYGFTIETVMNCDVNGQNWPIADALIDAGVRGFTMGVNEHFGGSPVKRPEVFLWEAPSGRTLPTFNGYHYATGLNIGIGRDAEQFAEERWPVIQARLDEVGFPLSTLMIQSYHPFGDNGPAYDGFGPFIRDWNQREDVQDGDLPRIEMSTPADWWDAVEDHLDQLATYRGDWTDFWNFGSISSAYETGLNRQTRRQLHTADGIEAALAAMGAGRADREPTRRAVAGTRTDAWWDLHLFDEHTWGSDSSVSVPDGDDARRQWHHKAAYAYDGYSRSQVLRRDAVAELARRVTRGGETDE